MQIVVLPVFLLVLNHLTLPTSLAPLPRNGHKDFQAKFQIHVIEFLIGTLN